jgi:hypothetical protein
MVIDNPCPCIDGNAVLVASYMLHVKIIVSPYMSVSGVESAILGKGTLIRMYSLSEQPLTKVNIGEVI